MKGLCNQSASNGVPFLQMRSVGSHSTPGREKGGKKVVTGMVSSWKKIKGETSKFVEVTTGMREKGINYMQWIDREEWREKNKILGSERRKTLIVCT